MLHVPKTGSRRPKWALFAAFLLTIPVPFIMTVVGGLVPIFFILFLAAQGAIVALPKFTGEGLLSSSCRD